TQRQGRQAVKRDAAPIGIDRRGLILQNFVTCVQKAGLQNCSYELAHAQLGVDAFTVILQRQELKEAGKLKALPVASQLAADKSYVDAAGKLYDGLQNLVRAYEKSESSGKR